jgi:hypothetical protein
MSIEYRQLTPLEVITEGDERSYYEDAGLMGGFLAWEPVPPWMLGTLPDPPDSIRRPVDTEKEELRDALRTCLHVIEKGIQVRMMNQWPVLEQILPQAVEKARKALRL